MKKMVVLITQKKLNTAIFHPGVKIAIHSMMFVCSIQSWFADGN